MFNNKTKAVQDTKPFCRLSIPTARLRINFVLGGLRIKKLVIGIDKESKSISFFCCSLYTDELGFFMQK